MKQWNRSAIRKINRQNEGGCINGKYDVNSQISIKWFKANYVDAWYSWSYENRNK